MYHSLLPKVVDDQLYVVHGKPDQNEDKAAISVLDLNSFQWRTLRPEGIPPKYPFTSMSSWVYEGRIYVFGGNHDSRIRFTEEDRAVLR